MIVIMLLYTVHVSMAMMTLLLNFLRHMRGQTFGVTAAALLPSLRLKAA